MENNLELINHNLIFNGEFYFNIALHVTILFTILSIFFITFISKVASNAINDEFANIIDTQFHNINNKSIDNKSVDNKSVDNKSLNNTVIEHFVDKLKNNTDILNQTNVDISNQTLIDNTLEKNFNQIPKNIFDQIPKNVLDQIPKNVLDQIPKNVLNYIPKNILDQIPKNVLDQIPKNILDNIKSNFNLDYYKNIFNNDDINRKNINNNVFNEIIHVNIFIYIILILFTIVLFKTGNLNFNEVKHTLIENSITFFFVGIIEVLFFMNIALKYIPAPPSIIFTSLIANLKSNFNS